MTEKKEQKISPTTMFGKSGQFTNSDGMNGVIVAVNIQEGVTVHCFVDESDMEWFIALFRR